MEGALEELERKKVEIVVMDIQLPGVDGVEGTRQMKARYPEVKVVIVSAYGEDYLVPSIDAGADGLSSKELASRLYISQTTLKREFRNIFNLLGVNDRAHAVAEAYRRNLI